MSVQTASKKCPSCETTTTVMLFLTKNFSKKRIAERSKWFVGSSNKRISGSEYNAWAKAKRIRHPPLSRFPGVSNMDSWN
mmetsp:Transcript_18144/g.33790  ORF Transcript_18144/g.33790 Transcript_18144/m.33790 type:complete len:80 (-) Transcript_18144:2-241(-)